MSLALRAEPEDASTAERLEASLTFIEAFYSDALTLPEEKQVLFDALAQIRLESNAPKPSNTATTGPRPRRRWLQSACQGITAGVPLAVLAGNWERVGTNPLSAVQAPEKNQPLVDRAMVGNGTPHLEAALATLAACLPHHSGH